MTITTQEQNAAALAGNHGFSIISDEKLLQIYRAMLKSRLLTERVRLLAMQGKLGDNCNPQLGLEAVVAGVTIDLLPGDAAVPPPGDLMVGFLRGSPLEEILARAGRPARAISLNRAVRAAMRSKTSKNGKIAVAFAGGDSCFPDEALEAARAEKLPILFVCRKRHSTGGVALQAGKIPILPVDGADAVAVYRVATESITHARRGNGPTLIECNFEPVEAHDPILKMETYLTRKGLFNKQQRLDTAAAFTQEMDAAFETALR